MDRGEQPNIPEVAEAVDRGEQPNIAEVTEAVRLAKDLLSDLDLDAVLNRVLESAAALSGARYAALGVTNEARTELERFITVGLDEETRERIGKLPRGRGCSGS